MAVMKGGGAPAKRRPVGVGTAGKKKKRRSKGVGTASKAKSKLLRPRKAPISSYKKAPATSAKPNRTGAVASRQSEMAARQSRVQKATQSWLEKGQGPQKVKTRAKGVGYGSPAAKGALGRYRNRPDLIKGITPNIGLAFKGTLPARAAAKPTSGSSGASGYGVRGTTAAAEKAVAGDTKKKATKKAEPRINEKGWREIDYRGGSGVNPPSVAKSAVDPTRQGSRSSKDLKKTGRRRTR